MQDYKIFTGTAHPEFSQRVAKELDIELSQAEVTRFSDGEIGIRICESVRGKDVFVIQSTCAPANDNLMELLIMIDALKRSSAKSINIIMPYFGYARQDRKASPRVPISAKLVADLLQCAGITRLVAMDLHAGQIQGFLIFPWIIFMVLLFLKNTLSPRISRILLWQVRILAECARKIFC